MNATEPDLDFDLLDDFDETIPCRFYEWWSDTSRGWCKKYATHRVVVACECRSVNWLLCDGCTDFVHDHVDRIECLLGHHPLHVREVTPL